MLHHQLHIQQPWCGVKLTVSYKNTRHGRRKEEYWKGELYQIMGILEEVDMRTNRNEVGLLMRQCILVNNLLYSAEVRSSWLCSWYSTLLCFLG